MILGTALMTMSLAAQPASLTIVNARVWTGNPGQPWAEAIATSGADIAAVGSNEMVRKLAPTPSRVIDARGRMVVPGFIDSHLHFIEGGFRLTSVQLRDAKSKEQFIARLKSHAAGVPKGTWIRGGDWDHENWGGELPTRQWIDAATPDHPVWINRLDGHMSLANSRALGAAGVTRATPDVTGGTIVRDEKGEPTGLLKDNAMSLVERVVPQPSDEQYDRALTAAMKYVAERGITSVHHMGRWPDLAVFDRARRASRLKTRIYAAVPLHTWERLRDEINRSGRGDEWLRIGALKGFVDGSLGSHTAAFLEPFADAPKDRGLLVNPPEKLYEWTSGATRAGLHVVIHAIGDRANRTLLDIYARVIKEQAPKDARFRIEHAQHLAPGDVARLAKLGVIASMQPYHLMDDGRWAEKVIGAERAKGSYVFQSLLESGARLAFGSDWFVAPPSPLEGIYAAVTRQTLDDKHPGGWIPDQKITVEQALAAYTRNAAYASFEEQRKGTLEPGKLADLAILDADVTQMEPWKIRTVKVDMTVVGGAIVYERQ
jgi:hypothetical protein